jgi:hypothetical protein
MRSLVVVALAVAAAAAAGMLTAKPAAAQELPWCAHSDTSCSYTSLEQCRASLSGPGEICLRNPRLPQSDVPARLERRRTR